MPPRASMGLPFLLECLPAAGIPDTGGCGMTTLNAERRELLADLRVQLPRLNDRRAKERTRRAIKQMEIEMAPGRARESEVLK